MRSFFLVVAVLRSADSTPGLQRQRRFLLMYRLGYEVPVCKDRLITDQDPCGLSLKHSVYNSDFALGYRRYALDIRQFQIGREP
ncbi:hypothetical protein F5B17DRAFT_399557 [Nemania serpens]|nr:hypothetical protein F5B17DRAFT_399557 [Nemania serpens]